MPKWGGVRTQVRVLAWLLALLLACGSVARAHSEAVRAEVELRPAPGGWTVAAQLTGEISHLRVRGARVELRTYPLDPTWQGRLKSGSWSAALVSDVAGAPLASAALTQTGGGYAGALPPVPAGRYALALVDTTFPGERAVAASARPLRPGVPANFSALLPTTQTGGTGGGGLWWLVVGLPIGLMILVGALSLRGGKRS